MSHPPLSFMQDGLALPPPPSLEPLLPLTGTVAEISVMEGFREDAVWVYVNSPSGMIGRLYGYEAAKLPANLYAVVGSRVTIMQAGGQEWIHTIQTVEKDYP